VGEESLRTRLAERGGLSRRIDDNPESICKRLKFFRDTSRPVFEHLEKCFGPGYVRCVDSGGSEWETFEQVKAAIDMMLAR
jgi:adenylate kinase family enzyme